MKKLFMTCLFALSFTVAQASVVAIIDSGTDLNHKDLVDHAWFNGVDSTENQRDEDRNGYQDDINGWNFAEGSNQIIDLSYIGTFSPDVYKFFDIQSKAMLGTRNRINPFPLDSYSAMRSELKVLPVPQAMINLPRSAWLSPSTTLAMAVFW